MKEKEKQTSKTLGILSIVIGAFVPLAGITLGIIGLSIKKTDRDRDITLNVVGIAVSILSWIIAIEILLG